MLRTVTHLQGFTIRATDGEIGKVDQLYFDDETWAIRYLVVSTGSWLAGRRVLISPIAVSRTDWESKQFDVALTKKQVEGSPDINTHKPVSRQHEADTLEYYGYPYYWDGPYLWGSVTSPAAMRRVVAMETPATRAEKESTDSHLRSTTEVTGYHIEAADGEIGHVEDFIVDHETWAIRYIEVDTRNWWPGKKVLVSPQWIERVSWTDSKVYVELSRETIKDGPEYIDFMPITSEYENRLYDYYGRPAYWLQEQEHPVNLSVSKDRIDASSDTLETPDSVRQRIEIRAYELYLSRGRADGGHLQDWLQAEAEVLASLKKQELTRPEDLIQAPTVPVEDVLKRASRGA